MFIAMLQQTAVAMAIVRTTDHVDATSVSLVQLAEIAILIIMDILPAHIVTLEQIAVRMEIAQPTTTARATVMSGLRVLRVLRAAQITTHIQHAHIAQALQIAADMVNALQLVFVSATRDTVATTVQIAMWITTGLCVHIARGA